jgi:hypothetical protein
MASTISYVNTRFIISNNQTEYPTEQIWVSFFGPIADTGTAQTIGPNTVTDFTSTWRSFALESLLAPITDLPYLANTSQYTFSLNSFSGRVFINYGTAALTASPNPSEPGNSPYIVFEMDVAGATLPAPTPTTGNIDLSYVDGVSAQAATMLRNATTGAALLATSVNPVSATNDIMNSVAGLVPAAAQVMNGSILARIMSSAACPSAYHDWTSLMNALELTTKSSPLKVCSYRSPLTGLPASYALNGALFGYSGAAAIAGQMPGFETMQDYTMTATFTADMNPVPHGGTSNATLNSVGITTGTAGVIITGSGTACGSFSIYIKKTDLNAGVGIYGNNPSYVVLYPATGTSQTAYATVGIWNDLGGRVVGDLMAGMVFGWSASTVKISDHAAATGTELYGTTFSATTVGGLSTGELFFLLSLAGSQGTLQDWLGPNLDSNSENYDPYLYAIAINSEAYGSGFTDRLQGYSNPDTYWYTANPPVIPGSTNNFETVGYVNMFLGGCETAQMDILLTNNGNQPLTLVSSSITGSSSMTSLSLPTTIAAGSTAGGYFLPASISPYQAKWTYSPDNGQTLLTFLCSLTVEGGFTIVPTATGKDAAIWQIGESPEMDGNVLLVTFSYTEATPM